jgi:hypothetical protein
MSVADHGHAAARTAASSVDAVLRESESLTAALRRGRAVRLFLILLTLALIAGIGWWFYNWIQQLRSEENLNRIQALAQERLTQNSDKYYGEVQRLVDTNYPVISQAFVDQVKKDLPTYLQAIDKERAQFTESIQKKLETTLNDRLMAAIDKHEALIQQELPATKDRDKLERIERNMREAMQRMIKKYYVDEMRDEMLGIYETWDRFPAAEPVGPNDPRLEDQLIGNLLEYLSYRFTHLDDKVPAIPASAR